MIRYLLIIVIKKTESPSNKDISGDVATQALQTGQKLSDKVALTDAPKGGPNLDQSLVKINVDIAKSTTRQAGV